MKQLNAANLCNGAFRNKSKSPSRPPHSYYHRQGQKIHWALELQETQFGFLNLGIHFSIRSYIQSAAAAVNRQGPYTWQPKIGV